MAGDGLGIISAMVVARLLQFSFWEEFWFEYAIGYALGWFIFQTWSMYMHTGSIPRASQCWVSSWASSRPTR